MSVIPTALFFFKCFFSKNIEADNNCRKCHEYGKNILGLRF